MEGARSLENTEMAMMVLAEDESENYSEAMKFKNA